MAIMRFVGIEGNRDCYHPNQAKSCTVGEFINYLQEYDEDMPLYLVNDNGYTFGSLDLYDISEHEISDDGDMDDDIPEEEFEESYLTTEDTRKRYQDSETYYIDIDGIMGERGEIYSEADMIAYWESEKDSDPSLQEFDSYRDWLRSTVNWMETVQGYELNESKKVHKHKLYIKDSKELLEDDIDVMELFADVDSNDIDHWGSDLYVRKTPQTTRIVKSLPDLYKNNITTFKDDIDFDTWYEIPFVWHK